MIEKLKALIIGGCPRSGTTLLSTLLSAHSKIFLINPNEGQDLETLALCCDLTKDDSSLADIKHWLEATPNGVTTWCEKSVCNIYHANTTLAYFGDRGRFLNVMRDGRDVVTSRHPNSPQNYFVDPRDWVSSALAGTKMERHPRVLTIRYEDLVRETEAVLRKICGFIDEPFESNMLNYPKSAKVNRSGAWFGGKAIPIHENSIGRWRQTENLQRIAELLTIPRANKLLRRYGYL